MDLELQGNSANLWQYATRGPDTDLLWSQAVISHPMVPKGKGLLFTSKYLVSPAYIGERRGLAVDTAVVQALFQSKREVRHAHPTG